jgi:hypothetical protein
MALQQSFEFSENQEGTIIYLNDETGEYDAISNTGGYGSPNTERTDLAIITVLNYKATDEDVEKTAESYDPEDVTQFEFQGNDEEVQALPDGHYQALVFSVARKTGSETPAENDFVYDFTGNQLQRWNGAAWVSATSADLVTYDATHAVVNHPHLKDLFTAFNLINKLLIGRRCEPDNDLVQYLLETRVMMQGGLTHFTEENFAEFQQNIERYQSRVDTILDLA